jgi:very-short-patch-repair endonuclease
METRLRLLLIDAGLPEPVIGNTIFDWTGAFVGTPDLAYVAERIAIEYEGDGHRSDPAVFAEDIERRERMQEAGWYVIRVIKDHVFRKQAWLVDRVRRQLRERHPV